jgi:hypothetical protein
MESESSAPDVSVDAELGFRDFVVDDGDPIEEVESGIY